MEATWMDLFVLCCFNFLSFNYTCPHFPPITPLPFLRPTSHIQSFPLSPFPSLSMVLCTCPLTWPFPFFLSLPPTLSPLVTVSLFFISMSLVLFCSLHLYFWLGSTYTWMDLKSTMLNEICQMEENKNHVFTYMWNIKQKVTGETNKTKSIDRTEW